MLGDLDVRLDEALGLVCEGDSPESFKADGEKRRSSSGAHRFDASVEFVQMGHDDKFMNGSLSGLTP